MITIVYHDYYLMYLYFIWYWLYYYHFITYKTMYEAIIQENGKMYGCSIRTVSYGAGMSNETEPQYELIQDYVIEFKEELNVWTIEHTRTNRHMGVWKTESEALDHMLSYVNEQKASRERINNYVAEMQQIMNKHSLNEVYKDVVVEKPIKKIKVTPVTKYLERLQAQVH